MRSIIGRINGAEPVSLRKGMCLSWKSFRMTGVCLCQCGACQGSCRAFHAAGECPELCV